MGIYNLDKLFSPVISTDSVVAVVSPCSGNQQSKEWRVYSNLVAGDGGRVCMVHPVGGRLAGCPIPATEVYSGLKEIVGRIGLVVTLGAMVEVPEMIDQCAELEIAGLVIMSTRQDSDDENLILTIMARARQHQIRILGFNSAGFIIPAARINLSLFNIPVATGNLALLSQSGAVISSSLALARKRGLGFSHVIGLGTLCDIDFGDLIDYLGWTSKVSCILLYIENLKDVKKFMSACRSVAMIKPIVAIRAGKSDLGRQVIEKHTGRPAGEDRVYDTALRRAGIIRVGNVNELLEAGDYLVKNEVPSGNKFGIITNSGGLGVMAVDALSRKEVPVSGLSPELAHNLKEFIAPYSGSLNPICIAADADGERYQKVLELIFAAREFSTIIVIVVLNRGTDPVQLLTEMRAPAATARVNLIYVWIGDQGELYRRAAGLSDRKTRICFSIEGAVLSCSYARLYFEKLAKLLLTPHRYNLEVTYNQQSLLKARQLVQGYLDRQVTDLSSYAGREILDLYGLPVNPSSRVASLAAARQFCTESGYPVAMKLDCGKIEHKSDIAGVLLNLRNDEALQYGFAKIQQIAEEQGLDDCNLTLEKMVGEVDYEVNLGSYYDIEFGPYIFLGTGGIQSRIDPNEEVILPPLDRSLARRLIDRTKLSRLCQEIRPFAIVELENILIRISQLVVDFPEIETLVLDPLIISGGRRMLAVDVKLSLKATALVSPDHLATTPYPNQYEFHETLKDGTPVLIRPIKPDDAAAHQEMVAGFSPQTRYFRFFSLREEITQEQLARFTQIDYDREIAVIAEVEKDGAKISIGVNRLLYYPHIDEYEFAIVVTDEWQQSGAGYLLMDRLIHIAKDRGIKEIFGLVMRNNLNMMNFIKKFGFRVVERELDVCRVGLDLTGSR